MVTDRLQEIFAENFAERGELGASVSIWHRGEEVLSLADGWKDREQTEPWTARTPVLFWSATKGLSAACTLHCCAQHGVPISTPVAEVWPEFAAAGKDQHTIADVLSHQAGLPVLTPAVPVLDHGAVVRALAEEPPHWVRGSGHGYHPRTFGFLVDEIVRRMSGGTTLRDYWRRVFAEPLGLDLWIGMDAARVDDVAPVYPARATLPKGDPFYAAFISTGSFTARAFGSPRGLHSVASLNTAEARTSSLPAFGGIGTASSLAKFYAMLAGGGTLAGQRYFDAPSLASMTRTLVQGADRVLKIETAFSAGFMRDPIGADGQKTRQIFGPSLKAFGHPGAGGSLAFADPENEIAFAYVMNQMEPGVLPNAKSLLLVDVLYDSLARSRA